MFDKVIGRLPRENFRESSETCRSAACDWFPYFRGPANYGVGRRGLAVWANAYTDSATQGEKSVWNEGASSHRGSIRLQQLIAVTGIPRLSFRQDKETPPGPGLSSPSQRKLSFYFGMQTLISSAQVFNEIMPR